MATQGQVLVRLQAQSSRQAIPNPSLNTARSRSFEGCATCRRRHVKCDERRPTCSMCDYFGLICAGYDKSIFFDKDDSKGSKIGRFRRLLLTEGERERMSRWLTSNVPPGMALRLLAQIDDECEGVTENEEIQISHGPFGAFRSISSNQSVSSSGISSLSQLSQDDTDSLPSLLSIIDDDDDNDDDNDNNNKNNNDSDNDDDFVDGDIEDIIDNDIVNDDVDDVVVLNDNDNENHQDNNHLVSTEVALSPWIPDLTQSIFDQFESTVAPSLPDFPNTSIDSIFEGISTANDFPQVQSISPPSQSYQFFGWPTHEPQLRALSLSTFSWAPLATNNNAVPSDAVLLLKHYVGTVITSLTPVRHTKTLWHVLFLPLARNCLAALALGEQLDHASQAAFYGTLAVSAYSLGGLSQSRSWLEQGRTYKQQALEHVRLMLKTAYDVPKAAKYKSILMALLTMAQLSILSSNRDQTECYLLEAEKLIRLRGLLRRKSRKVRLLHHCYAFMRILHESNLNNGKVGSTQRRHVREAVESSGLVVYGQDSLTFRTISWQNLDQEMMVVKSLEEGVNDLHLERPGLFPHTLYPEIYGVPEPWVYLLSQVIRLRNEKDAAEQDPPGNQLDLRDFFAHAKAIERSINRLYSASHPQQSTFGLETDTTGCRLVRDSMLGAMYGGLKIYFHRRIYDTEASMLQPQVISVRNCLWHCEQIDPGAVYGLLGLGWPAFVAASEAEDVDLQLSFSTWFDKCAGRTGLAYFTDTLQSLERIWREKREANRTNVTWIDLMKENVILRQHL